VPDELDLVRSFRSDIPGPSTDAWARARAAVAEASGDSRRLEDRTRTRRRWPLTVSALAGASGIAALVSALVLGGSQAAFAGWRATPTYLTAAQTAVAQDNCQAHLGAVPGAPPRGSWSKVAIDARGRYTMAVYEKGGTLASCFSGPSFTTVQAESLTSAHGGMAVSASGGRPPTTGPFNVGRLLSGGAIEQLLVSRFSLAGSGPYTLAEGRLKPTVSSVTLVLSDGQEVTATTGSAWLVAWWPGSDEVTAAQMTSASGTTTVPLIEVPFPTPPRAPSNRSRGIEQAVPGMSRADGTQSGKGGAT
jgi:hypothetical protein